MASPQINNLSCTSTNASLALSPSCAKVKIKNLGGNKVYFNINAAATTSHFTLDPTDEITIGLVTAGGLTGAIASVQAICDSTETATLNVIGVESWQ